MNEGVVRCEAEGCYHSKGVPFGNECSFCIIAIDNLANKTYIVIRHQALSKIPPSFCFVRFQD